MFQGQHTSNRHGRTRPGRARAAALGVAVLAAVTSVGIGAASPAVPASAAPQQAGQGPGPSAAPGTSTTTTTVVSPTTTVTTTTGAQSTTTSTTTVSAGPGSETSTTTTTVVPATSPSTTVPPRPVTTTTTTTVPVSTTTAPPATTAPGPRVPAPALLPRRAAIDATCTRPATPDLQTYLDALPAGSTFTSSTTACYLVPVGLLLTHPVTIVGGTFFDPTSVHAACRPYCGLKPIILIKNTSHVTLSGLSVLGVNTIGGYHASLVGQAGVKIMSSSDVTLTGITAKNTWGDGLELVADLTDHIQTPVTGLTVHGFTTINAGRQGVTLAEVASSVLDHVNVVSPADAGFDFESDIAWLGSSNVTISNCTDDRGFNIVEFLTGPITMTNCTGFHHVTLRSPNSNAPVTFVGGSMLCKRIDPVPCIKQSGGSLTFAGVSIGRMPGVDRIRQPVWDVQGGGSLAFVRSPIATPIGSVVQPAAVRFAP